ncbi:hypothetical protein C8Q76DRAFT_187482 [Earliella scabrosa]|nr:hypothetical protein C8Q76DRAFT_187482 [Earliella scabrosa]
MRNRTFTTFAAALYAVSVLPGAQAYCYYDQFGRRHCTLSTGRSARRNANLAYVNTSGVAGTVPPGPPPPGYAPQGGYYPQGYGGPSPYNGGYAPQYPPQTYNAQSPYPSPQPPPPGGDYAPPQGPPPNANAQYAPPTGPPPFSEKH